MTIGCFRTNLEYKFIIKQGTVTNWQQGQNKAVTVPEALKVEVYDTWSQGPTACKVLEEVSADAAASAAPASPTAAAVEPAGSEELAARTEDGQAQEPVPEQAQEPVPEFPAPVSTIENVDAAGFEVGQDRQLWLCPRVILKERTCLVLPGVTAATQCFAFHPS